MNQKQERSIHLCAVTDAPTIDWALFSWMQPLAERGLAFTVLATKLPQLAWFSTHKVTAVTADTVAQMAVDPQLNGRSWDIYYFTSLTAAAEFAHHREMNGRLIVQATNWELTVLPYLTESMPQWSALESVLAQANRVVVATRALRETAVARGADQAKTIVIPPGVNLQYFSPQPQSLSLALNFPLNLLATISLEWFDGLEYLLNTIRDCRDFGLPISLDIVGYGSGRQRLYYLLDEFGLFDVVTPVNHLPRAVLREKYQQTHFLLHTNLTDEVGVQTLEAMACGVPVLMFCGVNWVELLDESLHSLLVPVRQSKEMANVLVRFANDSAAFNSLREQVHKWISEKYSLDGQVAQYITLFSEIMDEPIGTIRPLSVTFAQNTRSIKNAALRSGSQLHAGND
jgi:glycosyltransferase involved in cell wall biosynthesis